MSQLFTSTKRIRKSFGTINPAVEMPNLIDIQNKSYDLFLQDGKLHDEKLNVGLHSSLKSVFPISDADGHCTLEYIDYSISDPKYDVEECKQRGINYSSQVKIKLRLIVWEIDEDSQSKELKSIKEQEVYLCDIPLMTKNGTFIVNGTERVVVSQMHRSPGVFFDHDKGKTHSSGQVLHSARIIPYRGSWLDFEFDSKDFLYFRIDRKRKIHVSTLLQSLGLNRSEILDYFYDSVPVSVNEQGVGKYTIQLLKNILLNRKFDFDFTDSESGQVLIKSGNKISSRVLSKLEDDNVTSLSVDKDYLIGKCIFSDVVNPDTGEILVSCGDLITEEILELFKDNGIVKFDVFSKSDFLYILNSLSVDKNSTYQEALFEIYKVLRPGEPATVEVAEELLNSLFFTGERYDLTVVGRSKLNSRLGLNIDELSTALTKDDILAVIKTLIDIKGGNGYVDDIDHLGNRRVRSVGELIENQFRVGLVRVQKAVLERIGATEIDNAMPQDIFNSKLLVSVIRDFFGSSQLSQFMDQTNPLSEVTHKRRLSALGPGGLTRDRAGFEVRDVHTSHYGRICPIETPEGPNIGLINSLATYANINKFGFIESPYRKVVDGKVTQEVVYLSAIDESIAYIAQSNSSLNEDGSFSESLITCRRNGEIVQASPEDVSYIDVTPMQVLSVAACLIPFLENDDANRALMGSNMQRQAVPLLKNDAPLVGTGVERVVAKDSGVSVIAKSDGVVTKVTSNRIVISKTESNDDSVGVDIYPLLKYRRTNQNTCLNHKPIVKVGDNIKKGDIIADGSSTDLGELALGKNVLVAFMPWNGYNFEDSILISERIVKDDVFTSIHVEQLEIIARDTKIGPEEITRDIPNLGEESLRHLDEVGTVYVGAEVKPGDILVGKVTPKSESPMTPEEKLLRAIFGEKASDVRDSSLRVPPGVGGTVVDVKIFSRRGVEKDERSLLIEQEEIETLKTDHFEQLNTINEHVRLELLSLIGRSEEYSFDSKSYKKDGFDLSEISLKKLFTVIPNENDLLDKIESLKSLVDNETKILEERLKLKIEKIQSGDDLPQGALKVVKVFLAVKRKLQPGDKMAGRHGNKGVISRILPQEDMPFLEGGQPVDMVLNPLGVPSRMNVGQILETHLGWASMGLGKKVKNILENYKNKKLDISGVKSGLSGLYDDDSISKTINGLDDKRVIELCNNLKSGIPFATPVFDGATESSITGELARAGFPESGQVGLYDGRTGEKFDRDVTVGCIYMLKLHHLVDDKIHARSIGPYSLVTQQPLGGKSHFGGQRFGEMECWALQAYGSSYTLQEMLTVKSDDVSGRVKMYESIVRGDNDFSSGIPESFHVMVKELRSLCLNVALEQDNI